MSRVASVVLLGIGLMLIGQAGMRDVPLGVRRFGLSLVTFGLSLLQSSSFRSSDCVISSNDRLSLRAAWGAQPSQGYSLGHIG